MLQEWSSNITRNIKETITCDWRNIIIRSIFAFSIPILSVIYFLLNRPRGKVYMLNTPIDSYLSFNKFFIVPYTMWYVYVGIFLIYFLIFDGDKFWSLLTSMVIGVLVCYAIFYIIPTTVARPTIINKDLFSEMVKFIYKRDKPYNCFPSIHVLHTMFITIYVNQVEEFNKMTKVLSNILAVFIILSTMLIKQHVLLDVAAGILLAYGVKFLVDRINIAKLIVIKSKLNIESNINKNLHA